MVVYEDFSIKIEPKRDDVFPVIVLESPAGQGRSEFRLPFDPDQLGNILLGLGQTVRSGTAPAETPTTGVTPQTVGQQLFDALFDGPVRSLLDRSMGMIHGQQKGLRIKIHIDPENPSLAALSSLPWEFIYQRNTRDFLNLSRFTPVVRYLDVQRPDTPLPLQPPLRILVVISAPEDFTGLNLMRERQLIEDTWAQQPNVEVDFVEDATILTLQDRLTTKPYHVLHYMGHGAFDEGSGQGMLVLEDSFNRGKLVDGRTMGILLRDAPSLRLVFLNACETARVGKSQGLDPFAGVASAMVLAGIPAVVAMQFPISDDAAINFSQRFYSLIARGNPVDTAVAEGRRAVRLAAPESMEWGTPVLFMRAPKGEIFTVSRAAGEPDGAPEEMDAALETAYRAGMAAFWQEDWDAALKQFRVVARQNADFRDVQRRLAEVERQISLRDRAPKAPITPPPVAERKPASTLAAGGPPPPAQKRGFPTWILAAAGLLIVAIVAAILIMTMRPRDEDDPNRTAGPAVSVTDTATATVVSTPTATDTPNPTATPSPTAELPTIDTPTPRPAAAPGPRFVTGQAVRTYAGPGTVFEANGLTEADQVMDVLARSRDGEWLRVCCVDGAPVWIEAALGRVQGTLRSVQTMDVPPPVRAQAEDTPTPRPSTATPTAVARPPTDTPTRRPTNTPTPCTVAVDPLLTASYDAGRLGCARTTAGIVFAAWQPFARGNMMWRSDTNRVSVLYNNGTWVELADQWDQVSVPPSRGTPPSGSQAPERGFGWIWGTNDRVFEGLGWATDAEKGFCGTVQAFENGAMLLGADVPTCNGLENRLDEISFRPMRFTLYGDGTWRRY